MRQQADRHLRVGILAALAIIAVSAGFVTWLVLTIWAVVTA